MVSEHSSHESLTKKATYKTQLHMGILKRHSEKACERQRGKTVLPSFRQQIDFQNSTVSLVVEEPFITWFDEKSQRPSQSLTDRAITANGSGNVSNRSGGQISI
jgi:hypothetical protein